MTPLGHVSLLAALVSGALLSCSSIPVDDPVHQDAVAELGDEARGVGPGPNHRPGQPCLVCHGGSGPGSPQWSVAGTLYQKEGQSAALSNADIVLTDATGATRTTRSNDVGNFYIDESDWNPVYPMHVVINSGSTSMPMKSRIGGTGSCADCHRAEGSEATMPPIYLEAAQ